VLPLIYSEIASGSLAQQMHTLSLSVVDNFLQQSLSITSKHTFFLGPLQCYCVTQYFSKVVCCCIASRFRSARLYGFTSCNDGTASHMEGWGVQTPHTSSCLIIKTMYMTNIHI